MSLYEEIVNLVNKHAIEFPQFGLFGIDEGYISQAESRLGILLPASYKWWLKNYGGGQIRSDIIYGLDDEGIGKPDIVELAIGNRHSRVGFSKGLVFSISNDQEFFFDTSCLDSNGEYPVYERFYDGSDPELYADSFAEFIKKRVCEVCE